MILACILWRFCDLVKNGNSLGGRCNLMMCVLSTGNVSPELKVSLFAYLSIIVFAIANGRRINTIVQCFSLRYLASAPFTNTVRGQASPRVKGDRETEQPPSCLITQHAKGLSLKS